MATKTTGWDSLTTEMQHRLTERAQYLISRGYVDWQDEPTLLARYMFDSGYQTVDGISTYLDKEDEKSKLRRESQEFGSS